MPEQTPDDDQRPTSSRGGRRTGGRTGRRGSSSAAGTARKPVPTIEAREGAAGFRHPEKPLLILCGAIASETQAVLSASGLSDAVEITALPAIWHNFPERIPEGVETKALQARRGRADRPVFVGYADCGTGGMLDEVCERLDLQRIAGPHCYSFFAGEARFNALADAELGTFYLTDYLARHFEPLIWEGMGLSANPEMRDAMFGSYTRLVYLAQTDDAALTVQAEDAARRLDLRFERVFTGYGELGDFIDGLRPEATAAP
ncbi:MAG: DUF1638 domain-containing protein [Alphaproteobacteria bacterium]